MACYLACISSSGVPLFLRKLGDVPQLTFPVVGSLNGVQWFTSNAKSTLQSCVCEDVKIVWRNYHKSITLILVSPTDSPVDSHHTYLLDLIFNAMVLMVGLHELLSIDDIETLKKDLKCCHRFIDMLLEGSHSVSPLTRGVEILHTTEHRPMMKQLEAMTDQFQTGYGCLTVGGRILLATDNWWQLHPQEIILLSLLVSHLPSVQCIDIPVYLPMASSDMAHRLLVFQLVDDVHVLALCDSEPSLSVAQETVGNVWAHVKDKLPGLTSLIPRCLPLTMTFDPNILALCLVNMASHQTILSLFASEDHRENTSTLLSRGYQGSLNTEQRRKYLVQFYKTVVDDVIPVASYTSNGQDEERECNGAAARNRVPHSINETYISAEDFKAYAIHRSPYNLFVLFHSETPTYALRRISNDVFDYLIKAHVL